ncbi:M43 family zinc metalloprotease [Flavobacteriales bacterium]|nr:M43 family zinc metalloprotease [Flavobacteriales bacterium]
MKPLRFIWPLFALLMFGGTGQAQHQCVHQKQREEMHRAHPEWMGSQELRRMSLEDHTRNFASQSLSCTDEDLLIPIVFHVVHDNGPENISDAQIHEAIVQMNEDFSATNAGLSDVHPDFTGIVADIGMGFRLADFDPNGQPTTGINRIQSELTYNGSDIALKQLVQWDPTMYLNVWVVHSSDGGNGSAFAFYPADVEGSASIYDGVVSSYWAVGRTETAVWTHYKILTHEVGHWANLKHTWGDQSGNQSTAGCGFDDAVDDTPNTIGNTGCDLEAISCGSPDNVQNYMDYSNCSNMFTEGQKERMLATMCSDVAGRNNIWSAENHALVFLQDEFLPRMVYLQSAFSESYANDGTVDGEIGIELLDLFFGATGALAEGVDFTSENLPAGTSLSVVVEDATHATIHLTGQVANHTAEDNLDNLELHFTANPFDGVAYEDLYNPSNTNLGLTFLDPYEIVFVDLVDDAHNFFEGRRWTWFTMGPGGADFGFFHYDLVNIKLETYGNGAVCYPGTSNLVPLAFGAVVGPESDITEPGPWYPDQLDLSNPTFTDWNGQTAYAGVQFQRNGNAHYGWIRMRVSEDGRHYYALDMAYNEEPSGAIAMGEVQSPVLAYTQTVFHEAFDNDGSISSERNIDLFGATWSAFDSLGAGAGFGIDELPEGLSAQIERVSDARIRLSLTGQANAHADDDGVSFNVSFDPSLLSDTPSDMALSRSMSVDFADPYAIEYVEVDPTEGIAIANPGNNWKYFSWNVGDADFGLWYINGHFRLETYSKSGVSNEGTNNLSALQEGDTIHSESHWTYFSELETQLVITSPTYSDWNGQTTFAGVKFTMAERFHYGWMRFEVSEAGDMVRLVDYAYNRKPEEEIVAGQIYATYGCTDPLALNFNPVAVDDDGTCTYPLDCGEDHALTLQMFDSYGDGWNGNALDISTIGGELMQSLTLNSGSEGATEFCLPDGCYTFGAGGGNYLAEISWQLFLDSVSVASGTGGASGLFSVNSDCSAFFGCTDEQAFNYDPNALIDDGSCTYPVMGCTDPAALNYAADAEEDDGSCYYEDDVLGCTDESALNHNPEATYDDGSCLYPNLTLDDVPSEWCMGDTLWIAWSGGNPNTEVYLSLIDINANAAVGNLGTVDNTGLHPWVIAVSEAGIPYRIYLAEHPYPPSSWDYGNPFTVSEDCAPALPGCTDPLACNFEFDATEDDGSCLFTTDALGICGGDCVADNNSDGICDPTCPQDLDQDGIVAVNDVLIMLSDFGCSSICMADINLDGIVSVEDFLLVLSEFGNSCN